MTISSCCNVSVLIKLMRSQWKARKVIKNFRPQVAVGVGGYASGPTLKTAGMMGVPTLIQEQNSYAGVTNKLLAQKARKICVAYDGMEKFFPADKIIMTGNPVRQNLTKDMPSKEEALGSFHLQPGKKENTDVQFIWQTGKYYSPQVTEAVKAAGALPNLYVTDFIKDMAAAYAAADLVISRAGAGSISEFCLLHKPVILVPSPNVAEDHQTKNAMALVNKQAAVMVKDAEVVERLGEVMERLLQDDGERKSLSEHILTLAMKDSDEMIAREILKIM